MIRADYVCDHCGKAHRVEPLRAGIPSFLPPPDWLEVEVDRRGKFDACSQRCAERIVEGFEV